MVTVVSLVPLHGTDLHVLQDFTVTIHVSERRHSQAYLQNHPTQLDRD